MQHFERHRALVPEVVDQKYGRHPAPAKLAIEPVTVSQAILDLLAEVCHVGLFGTGLALNHTAASRPQLERLGLVVGRCCQDLSTGGTNGQGGIRTLEGVAPLPVFETGSFSHSDTCPTAGKDKA